MTPTNFPQANTHFTPPADLDKSQCSPIPAFVGVIEGGNLDGLEIVVVAWMPSEEEKKHIAEGSPVFLGVMGRCLPPHFLATQFTQ